MSSQESWPPVSTEPQPPAKRGFPRWAWIPAVLAVPVVGWLAFQLSVDSPPEEPAAQDTNALGSLVPKPAAEAPSAAAAEKAAPKAEPPVALGAPSADDEAAGEDSEDDSELGSDEADDEGSDDGEDEGDNPKAATDDDGFWIQVASLRLKEQSDRLAKRLRDRGHDAESQAYGGARAGWWHVVRIGPFDTRIEAEKARLEFVAKERLRSTMVLPKAKGPYYVQVGSIRSEAGATKFRQKLERQGHHAYVQAVGSKKNGVWHIVRVGPFDVDSDAIAYQKILKERDGVSGEIVPRPSTPPVVEEEPEEAAGAKAAESEEPAEEASEEEGPAAAPELDEEESE